MARINLYDLLKLDKVNFTNLSIKQNKVKINLQKQKKGKEFFSVTDQNNLITKASLRYLAKINQSAELSFSLEKNIPLGAGLGGGSADAALALQEINGFLERLTFEDLFPLAVEIGSDVPFCLQNSFAFCEGKGEQLEFLEERLKAWVLVINDGLHLDTAKAYQDLDFKRKGKQKDFKDKEIQEKKNNLKSILKKNDLKAMRSFCQNDFEEIVFEQFPKLSFLKKEIYNFGADFSLMSGSGSTIFGLFSEKEKAKKAFAYCKENYQKVFLTEFI